MTDDDEQLLLELARDVEDDAADYRLRMTYSTAARLKNSVLRLLDLFDGNEIRPRGYGDTRDQ